MKLIEFFARLFERDEAVKGRTGSAQTGPGRSGSNTPFAETPTLISQESRFEASFAAEVRKALDNGRPIIGGTIEFVGLDCIRDEASENGESFAHEARRIAEDEIRRNLGPRDLFHTYDDWNFALCFHATQEKEAKARALRIAKAINARVRQVEPGSSPRVSVRPFVAQVPTEAFNNPESSLGETLIESLKRLDADARIAARAHRRKLLSNFQVKFAPVWNPRDKTTGMNRCVLDFSLGCSTLSQFQAIADPDQIAATLSDLDCLVVTQSILALHRYYRVGEASPLLVPVRFQTLNHNEDQGEFLDILAAIPKIYRHAVILEITAIPADASKDSILASCSVLRPFAGRLAVEINNRTDLLGSDLAEVVWGIGWNVYGVEAASLQRETIRAALAKARELGMETMAHGANTIGLAVAAVEAGFQQIDGTAIHLYSANPRAPVRLHPINYKERTGTYK